MTVYVLEKGCYNNAYVHGVYATLDEAKDAGTPDGPTFEKTRNRRGPVSEHNWAEVSEGFWVGNGDWGDAADIKAYEMEVPDR